MLNREQIKNLIKKRKLIENFPNLDIQLTPNGFDLTIEKIFKFTSPGALDFSNSERVIPVGKEIRPQKQHSKDKPPTQKVGGKYGWWNLKRGAYKIRTNEKVNLPKNLAGISFPRSSLLRMGVHTKTGVWDAGFEGKAEFILVVENPKGVRIKQNARIAQLIFLKISETKHGYNGIHKNLK